MFFESCSVLTAPQELCSLTQVDEDQQIPLSTEQQEVVQLRSGEAVVAAGPGTGKTHVVAARVVELLNQPVHAVSEDTAPRGILALTFTHAAALTLRQRVESAIPIDRAAGGVAQRSYEICTMHSFARQAVAEYHLLLGLPHQPTVLSRAEQSIFISRILHRLLNTSVISRRVGGEVCYGRWYILVQSIAVIWAHGSFQNYRVVKLAYEHQNSCSIRLSQFSEFPRPVRIPYCRGARWLRMCQIASERGLDPFLSTSYRCLDGRFSRHRAHGRIRVYIGKGSKNSLTRELELPT
eukprot:COSAG02_NODE_4735_length_5038_cov_116.051427_6_plen_294_part_00